MPWSEGCIINMLESKFSIHTAAHKIARLTGVTEGGAYQMLLGALIEAERQPPDEYLDALGLTQ